MADDCYHDILKAEGFKPVGSLDCDFHITLWWHPEIRQELSLVELNGGVLLRAAKQETVPYVTHCQKVVSKLRKTKDLHTIASPAFEQEIASKRKY